MVVLLTFVYLLGPPYVSNGRCYVLLLMLFLFFLFSQRDLQALLADCCKTLPRDRKFSLIV